MLTSAETDNLFVNFLKSFTKDYTDSFQEQPTVLDICQSLIYFIKENTDVDSYIEEAIEAVVKTNDKKH